MMRFSMQPLCFKGSLLHREAVPLCVQDIEPCRSLRCSRRRVLFISAIKPMAGCDGVELHISRDSPDADLCSAYRKVSRRVHPDRSGNGEDPKCLNAAHEAWVEAVSTAKGRGGRHAPRSDGADVWGQRGHGGGVADRAKEDAAGTTFPHPVLWCPVHTRSSMHLCV